MRITGLGWIGTRTDRAVELSSFYESVLGLPLVRQVDGFWMHALPDGRLAEVFDEAYPGKEHFTTGPVVGFMVEDVPSAVEELRSAGIELLVGGPSYQHFRAPDGCVYTLIAAN